MFAKSQLFASISHDTRESTIDELRTPTKDLWKDGNVLTLKADVILKLENDISHRSSYKSFFGPSWLRVFKFVFIHFVFKWYAHAYNFTRRAYTIVTMYSHKSNTLDVRFSVQKFNSNRMKEKIIVNIDSLTGHW